MGGKEGEDNGGDQSQGVRQEEFQRRSRETMEGDKKVKEERMAERCLSSRPLSIIE